MTGVRPAVVRPSHRQPGLELIEANPFEAGVPLPDGAAVKLPQTSAGLLVERDGAAVGGRR